MRKLIIFLIINFLIVVQLHSERLNLWGGLHYSPQEFINIELIEHKAIDPPCYSARLSNPTLTKAGDLILTSDTDKSTSNRFVHLYKGINQPEDIYPEYRFKYFSTSGNYIVICKAHFNDIGERIKEIVKLIDSDQNEYWTLEEEEAKSHGSYRVSDLGITLIYDKKTYNFIWLDKMGDVINSYEIKTNPVPHISSSPGGDFFYIGIAKWESDMDEFYDPQRNIKGLHFPSDCGLIIFDKFGNLYNKIEFNNSRTVKTVTSSWSGKYAIAECSKIGKSQPLSFLLDVESGRIIREYDDIKLGYGVFSQDESTYVSEAWINYIIDTESGDILQHFHSTVSAISNKDTHICASMNYKSLIIFDYIAEKILYREDNMFSSVYNFDIQISGDSSELLIFTGHDCFKYHLSE